MLSQAQRTAILELHAKGVSRHEISRVFAGVTSHRAQSPALELPERAGDPAAGESRALIAKQILELLNSCKGNLVRVHEELLVSGAALSYQALTCILPQNRASGKRRLCPPGRYHFEPGVEMQHDTSPHEVEVGGRKYKAQDRLGRTLFIRACCSFRSRPPSSVSTARFFLTEANAFMRMASRKRVMIDNTHVVVLRGTGSEMIPVPEMEAVRGPPRVPLYCA